MGEVVNLRMARKSRKRDDKERLAAENRARHGLGKIEKRRAGHERDGADRCLDNHRLTEGPSEE